MPFYLFLSGVSYTMCLKYFTIREIKNMMGTIDKLGAVTARKTEPKNHKAIEGRGRETKILNNAQV